MGAFDDMVSENAVLGGFSAIYQVGQTERICEGV